MALTALLPALLLGACLPVAVAHYEFDAHMAREPVQGADSEPIVGIAGVKEGSLVSSTPRGMLGFKHDEDVEEPLASTWSWELASATSTPEERVATPPVVVGTGDDAKACCVTDSGAIHCVGAHDGASRWSAAIDPSPPTDGGKSKAKTFANAGPIRDLLLVGSGDHVGIFDGKTGRLAFHRRLPSGSSVSTEFAFSGTDGEERLAAWGDDSGNVHVVDLKSGRRRWVATVSSTGDAVAAIAIGKPATFHTMLYAVTARGELVAYRANSGTRVWALQLLDSGADASVLPSMHMVDVGGSRSLVLGANGRSSGFTIFSVDVVEKKAHPVSMLQVVGAVVGGLSTNPETGLIFVTMNQQGGAMLRVWNPITDEMLEEVELDSYASTAFTGLPRTSRCTTYSGGRDGSIQLVTFENSDDSNQGPCSFLDPEFLENQDDNAAEEVFPEGGDEDDANATDADGVDDGNDDDDDGDDDDGDDEDMDMEVAPDGSTTIAE